MSAMKVAITIERELIHELDELVGKQIFPNRSKAIQEALRDKIIRVKRVRFATECAKLDPQVEKEFAELGMGVELELWPEY